MSRFFISAGMAAGMAALAPHPTLAQQPVPAPQTRYVGPEYQTLPTAEGALFREDTAWQDSLQGTIRTFYPGGARRSSTAYEHLRKGVEHGRSEGWFETGQLEWECTYVHGKLEGEVRQYYPTGRLKSRQQYAGGRASGICATPTASRNAGK